LCAARRCNQGRGSGISGNQLHRLHLIYSVILFIQTLRRRFVYVILVGTEEEGCDVVEEDKLYPPFRYAMAVLLVLGASLTHIGFLITAPMLVYLANDFSVDIATAGYASTMHIFAMGASMFVGPALIRKLDIKKTQVIGMAVMVLGALACFAAPSFPILLAARVVTGVGHGLSGSCTSAIVTAWFPHRERSLIVTINGLGIVGVTTLVYTATVPLYYGLGESWRYVILVLGGILAATALAWLIFARDNEQLNMHIRNQNSLEGRRLNAFADMRNAITRRDVWMLSLFMGLGSIGANGVSTYLPQFLQSVRNFSDVNASAIVGITTGIGAVGTFLGGVATTALGKRKAVILPFMAASAACITAVFFCRGYWPIAFFLLLYAFTNNFRTPASQTIATELEGATPAFVSCVSALSYGLGFMGTFLTSPLLKFSTKFVGETYAMLVFVPLFLSAILFAFLLPETGPKRKNGSEAAPSTSMSRAA
jgi:predicted MFS family arabinose efflux permease